MTAITGEEAKSQRDQIKKMILGKILVGLGVQHADKWIESASLESGAEILSQCDALIPGQSDSENQQGKLLHEGMSIWACWPTVGADLSAACIYVVLGKFVGRLFTTAVSSRLGRSLEHNPQWFGALRTYCLHLDRGSCLLTSPGQYTYRYLRRLADWIPVNWAVLMQATVDTLGKQLIDAQALNSSRLSQPSAIIIRVVASAGDLAGEDQCVAEHCNEVRTLHVRPNGNIEQLLVARLASANESARRTLILSNDASARPRHIAGLLEQGAIAWHVYDSKLEANAPCELVNVEQPTVARVLRLADIDPSRYVSHFTRRQKGGWLDESDATYLDSLLFGGSSPDRGSLATLIRIVVQRQLVANNRLTRDSSRVVCFTNRLLGEFKQLRSFRNHLARWDFEPYGIAIDRTVLVGAGARPVEYGSELAWQQMAAESRPFFQLADAGSANWEIEDEWRYVGDFDLAKVAPHQAIVFVASEDDAKLISPVSSWPVLVLQE